MQITEKTKIVQSNFLVENRPQFTKDETRLFLTVIGSINKDDENFNVLKIPVREFADLWQLDTKNAYFQIKTALRGLRKKEFLIEGENQITGKKSFLTASSVSAAAYEDGEGYAYVEISKMFSPYLLALKEKYTAYVLQNIMNLDTVSAIRSYEILKQYQSIGKRKVLLADYKQMLHIEDKYPRNIDLKRYIIEPSIEEINEKTDIYVTYEFEGRGIHSLVSFTIKEKTLPQQGKEEQNKNEISLTGEDLEYYQEIEQYRECLTDPNSLTHEQLDVCVTLAQTSEWYKNIPSEAEDHRKIELLKNYLKVQDKHSRANAKESFYGYFRRSCQNNWAKMVEVTTSELKSFELDSFWEAAVRRGLEED